MSKDEDKKRDRALQRRVRERQAKTGESYQDAWRKLTAPPPTQPPPETHEQLRRINTLFEDTIQVVGQQNISLHEHVVVLTTENAHLSKELEERTSHSSDALRSRSLQFQRVHVPPHQPTRVAAYAEQGAINIERIYIMAENSADWIVNDIEIEGRSQLSCKNLPGDLFSTGSATITLQDLDTVERDRALVLLVTYVGPNPEGSLLFAQAAGSKPPQRPTVVPFAAKTPFLPAVKTTITARMQSAPFQMTRLKIENGDTAGGAADWIVHDLRINGRTQFTQPDVPADVLATNAIDAFIKLEACEGGSAIELDMIYIGLNAHGAIFSASLEGTVLRDDYNGPPPDLRVIVEISDQGPGTEVIGICNWRAPASDNSTR